MSAMRSEKTGATGLGQITEPENRRIEGLIATIDPDKMTTEGVKDAIDGVQRWIDETKDPRQEHSWTLSMVVGRGSRPAPTNPGGGDAERQIRRSMQSNRGQTLRLRSRQVIRRKPARVTLMPDNPYLKELESNPYLAELDSGSDWDTLNAGDNIRPAEKPKNEGFFPRLERLRKKREEELRSGGLAGVGKRLLDTPLDPFSAVGRAYRDARSVFTDEPETAAESWSSQCRCRKHR